MSVRSRRDNPQHKMKQNVSPPKTRDSEVEQENWTEDDVSSLSSCDSSCLSWTAGDHKGTGYDNVDTENSSGDQAKITLGTVSSPMVVLGCPGCLMYVMLPEAEPRCPWCKSTVLLDLFGGVLNSKEKKST